MNEIIRIARLWYCAGTSDKVYVAQLYKTSGGNFMLRAEWGRRGKTMQSQIKGVFDGEWDATRAFHSLVASKTAKGYRITDSVPA